MTNNVLPAHVGFIMDGNGRWAKRRGLPRNFGHREGAKAFKKCVDYCAEFNLKYVTFYAFSTENKKRPPNEVEALLELFDNYLDDIKDIDTKNARLKFIGDVSFFKEKTREKMREAEEQTKSNTGLTCTLALNYGGRSEILYAVGKLLAEGKGAAELTEKEFEKYLYTKDMPDVDLIIRTGGERRISNFLIWQTCYAEYIFTDVLWPDFKKKDLEKALSEYAERSRRFGGL